MMRNKCATVVITAVTPIILGAGAYLAWSCARRVWERKNKKATRPRRLGLSRSVSMGSIRGGKVALQRLQDFHAFHLDAANTAHAESDLETQISEENPDIGSLQRIVGKLEMGGKEESGLNILKRALHRAREQKRPHEAYEIEMLMVELLIYKGDFEGALNCGCLEECITTDARRPLYKAIIRIMQGDDAEEAPYFFEEFREIQKDFQWGESQNHKVVSNFKDFKKFVEVFKLEIQKANR